MSNKVFYSLVAVFIIASTVFWIYMFQDNSSSAPFPNSQTADVDMEGVTLTMYHSPTCGCCVNWAKYLEDHGVEVITEETMNVYSVKEEHGVPNQLSSCHTAVVDGYVVEGHVPVEDIQRLLAERPDVTGIAVPGMPQNSPGMDMPSDETYQSVLFDGETVTVYNTHN
ncbi:DUF411 domain-containing protein [Rhodohalobacter sp. 614A]|uniref:DUF411 domain-containing protein n=1 Tax=Rhodohalobacter sp. 614A TaxID=2908649 RepID=UPI001F3FD803|nr:DUF411 domain-containing protein [Rhodohalobacter sp. 614A]